jgi:hypothetical protein
MHLQHLLLYLNFRILMESIGVINIKDLRYQDYRHIRCSI